MSIQWNKVFRCVQTQLGSIRVVVFHCMVVCKNWKNVNDRWITKKIIAKQTKCLRVEIGKKYGPSRRVHTISTNRVTGIKTVDAGGNF